jgi:hypothetical protein
VEIVKRPKGVVKLSIFGVEKEAIHNGRNLTTCGELRCSRSVWRSNGRIRLDAVRDCGGVVATTSPTESRTYKLGKIYQLSLVLFTLCNS